MYPRIVQEGTQRRLTLAHWGLMAVISVLVGSVFFPVFVASGPPAVRTVCLSNVKQLALGFVMYAIDSDDRLPAGSGWMDSLKPYEKSDQVWRCPVLRSPDEYGYAMRERLSGANTDKIKKPESQPLVFDSVLLGRNAVSDRVLDPGFTRHRGLNIGFLDGHAHDKILSGDP